MPEMAVMDPLEGDHKIAWDPNDPNSVEEARRSFDALVRDKKYLAFKTADPGDKGEQIREFDPSAGTIIMTPPMAGG